MSTKNENENENPKFAKLRNDHIIKLRKSFKILKYWLKKIKMETYIPKFKKAGYLRLESVKGMKREDLKKMETTNDEDLEKILNNIGKIDIQEITEEFNDIEKRIEKVEGWLGRGKRRKKSKKRRKKSKKRRKKSKKRRKKSKKRRKSRKKK